LTADAVVARFTVRLTPRASLERVDGIVDGVLHVRVRPPAVDGAANAALVRLIARELDVPPSTVRIAVGGSSRQKQMAIDGLEPAVVRSRWPGIRCETSGARRVSSSGRPADGTGHGRPGSGD